MVIGLGGYTAFTKDVDRLFLMTLLRSEFHSYRFPRLRLVKNSSELRRSVMNLNLSFFASPSLFMVENV